jgi:hypothetical protein
MYIVNASKFITLNLKKLSKMESDSVDQSNSVSLSSTPDGPSTIWIKNLSMVDPDDEGELVKSVIDFIEKHPEHFFLLEECEARSAQKKWGIKMPSNVFIGHVVRPGSKIQHMEFNDTFKWLLIQNPEDFNDFKAMENYNWVVLDTSSAAKINLKNISTALVVKHCNKRSLPVSVYPANVDLASLDAALCETDSGKHDPLYYELPILEDRTLMMKKKDLSEVVSNTNIGLQHWVLEYHNATMAFAYFLFKMIKMARQAGQKSFWNTYFGVDTVAQFTGQFLEISRSQMYRYLEAAEVMEMLFPGMMLEIISAEKDVPKKVLCYSRWLPVYQYRYDIVGNPNGIKDQVKRMLLDPAVGAGEILELLAGEFPRESTNKKPEPFDIIGTLKMFNMSMMSQMVEGKRIRLYQHLKGILWLYISDLQIVDAAENVDKDFEEWGKSLEATLREQLNIAA